MDNRVNVQNLNALISNSVGFKHHIGGEEQWSSG